jgi:hypothetical protein
MNAADGPGVASVIVSPDTAGQLDDAVAALDLHLDNQARTRLDDIFPATAPPRRTTPGEARHAAARHAEPVHQ